MPPPTTAPIGVVLARTAKTASRAFDHALTAAGSSQPIWQILISLKTTPVANQRELADAVGIQGATLTHHLNGMETTGLVTRRRDPDNRRIHVVELTDHGEQLFHQLATAAIAHDKRLRAGFTDDEITTLASLLHRLAANLTDQPAPEPIRRE
ncbi:MarR family winged helix-turn-helix transcriptional regulator [Amycolatopsis sp. NBC_01286]|uniref:MarR family winged helix-turn-helix transcriptional regulator n=1 Tax=Amycolatopsis sp. NBC_01286 TaxID=2903560 RepID=UPI002E0FB021|nr:MarR family winged helix-turn-helix transcriptional regulator [Amycolatopsis sp. NBC_01286]